MSGALKPPPFDPEIAQALEEFAAHIVTSMTREDIPRVREAGIPPTEAACTMHGYFERRELVIPGAEGAPDIPAVTYLPRATTRPVPVILMLHGGGLVAGRPDSDMPPASELAAATGCGVISVDYRLAPEHPHPAAIDDCVAALRWLSSGAAPARFDASRIVLMGVSAGGGLAAVLAQHARDHGIGPVRAVILASPMLDARTHSLSARQMLGVGSWDATANLAAWSAYLGADPRTAAIPPYASASLASDFSDLPPHYIDVGSVETFRDECVEYASAIWAAGGDAELHVWPGGAHGFEFLAPWAQVSRQARATRIAWLRRVLARL